MRRQRRGVKRLIALLLAAMPFLGGCHTLIDDELDTKYITTTFYPIYALAVNIMKDVPAISLSCMTQPQDGCLRAYTLSDWDLGTLTQQDAIILGGRGLESFEAQLSQLPNQPILFSALEGLRLREEDAGEASDDESHFHGANPWTFLSISGAMDMSAAIANGMQIMDETFAERYAANLQDYMDRLNELIRQMIAIVSPAPHRRVALLHEGLPYFADQFHLDIALIYPREPGSDLIDNDLQALLEALDESDTQVVFLEIQAPKHLVDALETAGYSVALLDTLCGHTADGDTQVYERVMLANARAAYAALAKAH